MVEVPPIIQNIQLTKFIWFFKFRCKFLIVLFLGCVHFVLTIIIEPLTRVLLELQRLTVQSNGLASDAEKRKRLIMRVQFALLDRGFYNGNIDGIMGSIHKAVCEKLPHCEMDLPIPATGNTRHTIVKFFEYISSLNLSEV